MKSLKAFLCEADIDWIGSGWEPSSTYQIITNHYHDKITPENINSQLSNLVDNHKWNTYKSEWVKKSSVLNKESEIDAYIDNIFKNGRYDRYHDFEKEIIRTRYRTNLLNDIKHSIDVNKQMIRNIKLDSSCVFGAIAFHSGDMKKYSEGYLKISDKSTKNKLVLEYTDNEVEALKLNIVGDLLDLLTSYKETKLLTESAGIGSKFANSINIRFDNNFKEGKLAVLKFKG